MNCKFETKVLGKVKLYTTSFYRYLYIDLKFSPSTFEACKIYFSCSFRKLMCKLFLSFTLVLTWC